MAANRPPAIDVKTPASPSGAGDNSNKEKEKETKIVASGSGGSPLSPGGNGSGGGGGRRNWSNVSSDVMRKIFLYACNPGNLYRASMVCRNWGRAIDHPTLWNQLCLSESWPRMDRRTFTAKYRSIAQYRHGLVQAASLVRPVSIAGNSGTGVNAGASGVIGLYAPPRKRFFNWTSGKYEVSDERVVIAAGAAPKYGFTGSCLPACRHRHAPCAVRRAPCAVRLLRYTVCCCVCVVGAQFGI